MSHQTELCYTHMQIHNVHEENREECFNNFLKILFIKSTSMGRSRGRRRPPAEQGAQRRLDPRTPDHDLSWRQMFNPPGPIFIIFKEGFLSKIKTSEVKMKRHPHLI